MTKLCVLRVVVGVLWLVPVVATADAPGTHNWPFGPTGPVTASTVDFDTWMQELAYYPFGGENPLLHLDPDGYWTDDPLLEDPDPPGTGTWVEGCDNNGNGILDAKEFALITAVCNDTGHPLHDTVHEALKANEARSETDVGVLAGTLLPPLRLVMGAYASLGDGDYTRAPETFEGSWGVAAETIYWWATYESLWIAGAPADEDYTRQPELLSACGDFDDDGVTNIREYYGQGEDRALYVAAAMNPLITVDGGDLDEICGVECEDPPGFGTGDVEYLVGDALQLAVPCPVPPVTGYTWYKDYVLLEEGGRISGVFERGLVITDLVEDDSGLYSCAYSDGNPVLFHATVTVTPGTPAAGMVGLGVAAGLLVLGGAVALNRAACDRRQ